ncbi:MAG: hypothetical protein H7A25_03720 [Leptospiraceae bacterium]|nr:hypothetical protein [Leptospiraceae bacterium]
MVKSKKRKKNELSIFCPKYSKAIKSCPSSKDILMKEDVKNLLNRCSCEKFKTCSIYLELEEKAA